MLELLVRSGVGPGGVKAEFVAALIPEGDLFDGGLLEVRGEGGLTCADGCAGGRGRSGCG